MFCDHSDAARRVRAKRAGKQRALVVFATIMPRRLLLCIAILANAFADRPIRSSDRPILRKPHLVAEADTPQVLVVGKAELPGSIINLVKAIVGAGVLSLPVGIAKFSGSRTAIGPACLLMLIVTSLSAYCFGLVARVLEATGTQSWGDAWASTVGHGSSWIPSAFVAMLCACASLTYTMVIGDSFSAIFAGAGLPAIFASRTGAILFITLLFTLPLSLLPTLEILQVTSFLGIGGILYTAAFMILRIGAYAPDTALHAAVSAPMRPRFDTAGSDSSLLEACLSAARSPKIFVLTSIMTTAMGGSFIAPQFYNELWGGASYDGVNSKLPHSKLPRFAVLTFAGFGLSMLLSGAVMVAGFKTFGAASDGYILNNYATADALAQAARLAIGGSIVCTYPILHQGLRDAALQMLRARGHEPSRALTSLLLVWVVTVLGVVLTDLGVVAAVMGSLVSTTLIFTLPALMFAALLSTRQKRAGGRLAPSARVELLAARAIAIMGIALAGVGIKAAFSS